MDNNELQHWGIKGQKWGLRRFQNKDGSLTPAGRKRYGEEEDEKSKKDDKKPKTETEVEIPKPKTKAEVLKSGTAKELMEFRGEISAAEYQNVFKRFEDEKKLASYSEAETKSALDKFDDIMSKVDRVRVGSEKAISAYNTLAKINNAFNPSFRLPEIKEGKVNQYIEKAEKAREEVRLTKKLEKAEEAYKRGNKDALNNLTVDEMKSLNSRSQDKATVEGRFKGQMKGDKKDKDSKPKNASDSKPKGTVKEEAKPNKTIPATEKGFDGASYFKPKGTITEEDHPNKTIPATEKDQKAEEAAKRKTAEEAAKRKTAEEAAKRKKAEEAAKRKKAEETKQRKAFNNAETVIKGKSNTDGSSDKKYRKDDIILDDDSFIDKTGSTAKRTGAAKNPKWDSKVRTSGQDKTKALALVSKTASSALSLYNAGKSVAEIARQYGLSESAIYKLLEEYK